jgi:hypothetical protein
MLLPPKVLGRAQILNLNLIDEKEGVTLDMAAETVSWLISVYSQRYSADLALSVARKMGLQHFVAVWNDLSIVQAFIADEPQTDPANLTGNALTILGTHSLSESVAEILELDNNLKVKIGPEGHHIQFLPDDEKRMLLLAEELPWYRQALGLEPQAASGYRIVDTAVALGMPRTLIGFPD